MQNEIKLQREELIKRKEEEKNRIKKEDEQYIDDWKKKMKMIEMENYKKRKEKEKIMKEEKC